MMTLYIIFSGQRESVHTHCSERNSRPRLNNDLMNYEQNSMSSDQEHGYQEKTRLELITGNENKT
jgi:hypothetical protein